MPTELVRVTTSDNLFLDGALHLPDPDANNTLPVDAFILVHGTGSNFYAPGVLETFAEQAAAAGVAAIRINTRGHDNICSLPGPEGTIRGGAAFESIADCRIDLHAWINFALQRGYKRIALAGHSMGGVKSVYTMSVGPHPAVRFVITITSPRFKHANFAEHPQGGKFRGDFERARGLVEADEPFELLEVTQPLPMIITARGYLEKYGPQDTFDLLSHVPNVTCPVLMILGTQSVQQSLAFVGQPDAITELAAQHDHIQLELVEGASTNYAGCRDEPFLRTARWLSSQQVR